MRQDLVANSLFLTQTKCLCPSCYTQISDTLRREQKAASTFRGLLQTELGSGLPTRSSSAATARDKARDVPGGSNPSFSRASLPSPRPSYSHARQAPSAFPSINLAPRRETSVVQDEVAKIGQGMGGLPPVHPSLPSQPQQQQQQMHPFPQNLNAVQPAAQQTPLTTVLELPLHPNARSLRVTQHSMAPPAPSTAQVLPTLQRRSLAATDLTTAGRHEGCSQTAQFSQSMAGLAKSAGLSSSQRVRNIRAAWAGASSRF